MSKAGWTSAKGDRANDDFPAQRRKRSNQYGCTGSGESLSRPYEVYIFSHPRFVDVVVAFCDRDPAIAVANRNFLVGHILRFGSDSLHSALGISLAPTGSIRKAF